MDLSISPARSKTSSNKKRPLGKNSSATTAEAQSGRKKDGWEMSASEALRVNYLTKEI